MELSDFGSWASIVSLLIGLVAGFVSCKKISKQSNKQNSVINTGNTKQTNINKQ